MLQSIRKHMKKDNGATSVEYVLLVVAIALVMVIGAFALGGKLKTKFSNTGDCVGSTTSAGLNANCGS